MARASSPGSMALNTRVSSETMKSQELEDMTGLMGVTMRVKFLTVSDMVEASTHIPRKA